MIEKRRIKGFQQQLEERQSQILEQLEHFEEDLAYLEQSRPPDFSEEAQEEAAANSLKALDAQERRELADIILALKKIEAGTFGTCELCSRDITTERLTALPMVRLCFRCQEYVESRKPR